MLDTLAQIGRLIVKVKAGPGADLSDVKDSLASIMVALSPVKGRVDSQLLDKL